MAHVRKTPLDSFRRRQKLQGIVRVEVQVHKQDAVLVRSIAQALVDPAREIETRRLLRTRFAAEPPVDLKALLASAPFEEIDLERSRDLGRSIEL